jgi:hypothetical protein
MRKVTASEAGGALYSQRQWMVEPDFAQIKANRRIDRSNAADSRPPAPNDA